MPVKYKIVQLCFHAPWSRPQTEWRVEQKVQYWWQNIVLLWPIKMCWPTYPHWQPSSSSNRIPLFRVDQGDYLGPWWNTYNNQQSLYLPTKHLSLGSQNSYLRHVSSQISFLQRQIINKIIIMFSLRNFFRKITILT